MILGQMYEDQISLSWPNACRIFFWQSVCRLNDFRSIVYRTKVYWPNASTLDIFGQMTVNCKLTGFWLEIKYFWPNVFGVMSVS